MLEHNNKINYRDTPRSNERVEGECTPSSSEDPTGLTLSISFILLLSLSDSFLVFFSPSFLLVSLSIALYKPPLLADGNQFRTVRRKPVEREGARPEEYTEK